MSSPFKKITISSRIVFLLLLLFPSLALSDVTSFVMEVVNDGVVPFDADNNPGNDQDQANYIVRTHDEVRYRFIIGTDGGDTNVVFTATIPDIPATVGGITIATAGNPLATWRVAPPQCTGPATAITNNGKTLTCDLEDIPNPSAIAIEPVLDISGEAPNGAVLSFLDGSGDTGDADISSDQTVSFNASYIDFAAMPLSSLDETVSAAPRFDLVLGRTVSGGTTGGQPYWAKVHAASGPPGSGAGADGLVIAYNVQILATRLKGSEMLEPSNDIFIVNDISALIDGGNGGALAIDWIGPVVGNNAYTNYNGCENDPINFFYAPRDLGAPSTDVQYVANGGTCVDAQPGGAGSDITLTISGNDSSLLHYPIDTPSGVNIENLNRYFILSKRLGIWVPKTSLNPLNVVTPTFNRIDFNPANLPVSISGQTNTEPDLTNNELARDFLLENDGGFSKAFVAKFDTGPFNAPRDTRVPGNSIVNFVSPFQVYNTRVGLGNEGSNDFTYTACEKIDNSRQVVVPNSNLGDVYFLGKFPRDIPPNDPNIEWGVQVGDGLGSIMDSWGNFSNQALESDGGDELPQAANYFSIPDGSFYTDSTCPDADPTGNTSGAPFAYFSSLIDVLAAGFSLNQVTMLRLSGVLGAGQRIDVRFEFQLLEFFAYDANDIITNINGNIPSSFTYSYLAGDRIPNGSHVPNEARVSFPELGVFEERSVDVFEVEFTRFLRIQKSSFPPPGGEVGIGDLITYFLTPNYTTPNPPTSGDVIVEDVLPPGINYVGTVSGPSAPVVTPNSPSAGYTTLQWTYSSVLPANVSAGNAAGDLPPIEFTASVAPQRLGAPFVTGDSFANWTSARGENPTDFDNGVEADCVFDVGDPLNPNDDPGYGTCLKADSSVLTINSPAGIVVYKEVLTPVQERDQPISWRLNWSAYRSAPPPDLNVIDIFPFNGDDAGVPFDRSPGSSFSGSTSLTSVTPVNDLASAPHNIYLTDLAPSLISEDPQSASNLSPGAGASIWCLLSNIGTAGCPATLGDATAVLVEHSAAPVINELYSLELNFQTLGNATLDNYTNNHYVATLSGGLPPIEAKDVVARVVDNSLGNLVWLDYDRDGFQDVSEPGIQGVTVTLHEANTGVLVDTVTTNTIGEYLFDQLVSSVNFGSNYEVRIDASTLPAGLVPVFDLDGAGTPNSATEISLAVGEVRLDADFGYTTESSISVTKTISSEIPPTSSWVFSLSTSTPGCILPLGLQNPQATADGSGGLILFDNLQVTSSTTGLDCEYSVSENSLNGWSLAANSDALAPINVVSGVTTNINLLNELDSPGSIGDFVWEDLDGDGVRDTGESGISGVTVHLTYFGIDGTLGGGDDFVLTSDITDSTGAYQFNDLFTGNYLVQIDSASIPAGFIQGFDPDSILDNQTAVTLTNLAIDNSSADFGYVELTDGVVGDTVWDDVNGNGVQDAGESGLAGVTVTLTSFGPDGILGGGDDIVYPPQVTTPAGSFMFSGLPEGVYELVTSNIPSGYFQTFDPDGIFDNTSVFSLTNSSPSTLSQDFAYGPPSGGIGSLVWLDFNNDGIQDSSEPGAEGVTVVLNYFGADGVPGGADDTTFTQVTDANGNYSFTGLPGGNYEVFIDQSTLPSGNELGFDFDGGEDGRVLVTIDPLNPVTPQQNFGLIISSGEASVLWNGFCDQQNFVSMRNTCTEDVTVDVNLFGSTGEFLSTQSVLIGPGDLLDFSINSMAGFSAVNYGVAQLLSLPGGCITGDMGLFAPIGQRGQYFSSSIEEKSLGESSVLFTLSDGSQSNACYLTYNTFQPSLNPADLDFVTTHWLQLVNKESNEKIDFTVNRYDVSGAVISDETAIVNPFGRQDIAAGHEDENLNRFGIIEISPNKPGFDYLAQLYRYGVDSKTIAGEEMSSFSLAENCSTGAQGTHYLTISKGAGVRNWVELYNINKEPEMVSARVYSNTQGFLKEHLFELESMSSLHFDAVEDFLAGESGIAEITALNGGRLLSKSTSYLYDNEGRVVDASIISGKEKVGSKVSGSFNTYRNQLNWLRLFNVSSGEVNIKVSAYSQQNEKIFGVQDILLPAKSGKDFDLNGELALDMNKIGRVELEISSPDAVLGDIVRVQHGEDYSLAQAFEVFELR